MERPRSMIGTMPPPSTPSHRRNASSIKSISKLQTPSSIPSAQLSQKSTNVQKDRETIQLYISNVRLLGLHQLPDWPGATIASLTSSDSKTRMRCVEWTLYQLFRLYDQQMTTDKLQPFFPPLDPLQSLNLRAALYRCLNELKKNGAVGREVVVRKTMLDDCTGDKFWELCLSFSAAVLRKATLANKSRLPIAQRLATAKTLDKKDKESLLPLAVAHKSALSRVLSQKHQRRQSYIQVFDSMKIKEEELISRKNVIGTQPAIVESAEHAEELELIEQEIRGVWTHDDRFKDAVMNGGLANSGDQILLLSTDDFVASLSKSEEKDMRRDSGVLENIELQARAQSLRVTEWQAMYANLRADKRSSTSSRSSRDSRKFSLQFDKHRSLGIDNVQPPPTVDPVSTEPRPAYVSKYDEMLTSMREDLRRVHAARREADMQRVKNNPPPPVAREPSITLDAVAGAPQLSQARTSQRAISPSFPLRPEMAKRISSRSRSYQQPKVISQREPIPLKSEIFSPLRRTGSVSPASARSSLTSPLDSAAPESVDNVSHSTRASVQSGTTALSLDSIAGLGSDLTESPTEHTTDDIAPKSNASSTASVSFAHRKSLSERTRMSMAFTRLDDDRDARPITQEQSSPEIESPSALASRTRQSMAGISVPLPIRASMTFSHGRSNSVVPQILLPKQRPVVRQTSRSFSGADGIEPASITDQGRREITPRERLFEADAEYNSVFKSRPKIAASPPLAPATNADIDPADSMRRLND